MNSATRASPENSKPCCFVPASTQELPQELLLHRQAIGSELCKALL